MITENTIVIEPFYKAPHMDFRHRNMDGSRSRKEEKTIDLEKLTLKAMYAQVLQNTRDIKELKDGMLTVKDVQGIAEDAIIAKLEELNLLGGQFRKVSNNPAR